ncbi:PBSX family phage terminase large subunit [Pyramidobacter piscolens]|uniref:PBSX family phage terminase large subunit n=1 Tax=Pyramidobacter piscolens TaxID=638849 RepID=UPI001FCB4E78|nr:PBSX family phage terminase large subunit [Pyramidobacter piscolens]
MPKEIKQILFPKQIESCQRATARLNIWEGSVSSGKTYCSIWKWLSWLALDAPKKGAFLMTGKTERTLQRNILDPIMNMIGEDRFTVRGGEASFMGRTIYLCGASDARAENKIRGATLAGAYGDEITLWPESFFKMLLSRLRLPGARFFGTTNPDSPFHWLKVEYLDRESELNLKRFAFRLYDNVTLDPDYVSSIEREYTGLWYRRFILGEWCQAEGAIYDMFDESRHVVSTDELNRKYSLMEQCVGVDYGTGNPTAALLVNKYHSRPDHRYHAAAEYYYSSRARQRQKTDAEYVSDFESFYSQHNLSKFTVPLVIDPSAASLKLEARRRGFRVFDANNAVLDGIRTVGTLFSKNVLTIDPSCSNLRAELPTYVWDKKAQDAGQDVPVKANDHACDAVRYGVMQMANRGVISQHVSLY